MASIEKWLETKLLAECKSLDCLCMKFISPGNRGVPDRLIFCKGGKTYLVEVKDETVKELKGLQDVWQRRFRSLDFDHRLINSKESLNKLLDDIRTYLQTV